MGDEIDINLPYIRNLYVESLGSILIGFTLAAILYGGSVIQTFIYFRMGPRDGLLLKFSVFFLWLLDTAHIMLLTAVMWILVVKDMAIIEKLNRATWTFSAAIFVTCAIELGVRGLFVNRIHKLSRGNMALTILLSLVTLVVFGFSLRFGVEMGRIDEFFAFHKRPSLVYIPFAVGLASDVAITGSQCFLLWRNKTGATASDSIVHTLILYILNSGILICLVTAGILISYIMSHSLIFIGIYVVLPKAFFNAILLSLNIRELVFGDPAEIPTRTTNWANLKRKLGFAPQVPSKPRMNELAVHVQTTTQHLVEEDKITDMWMHMHSADKTSFGQLSASDDTHCEHTLSDDAYSRSSTKSPSPRCGMRRYM